LSLKQEVCKIALEIKAVRDMAPLGVQAKQLGLDDPTFAWDVENTRGTPELAWPGATPRAVEQSASGLMGDRAAVRAGFVRLPS
jgi:hypothetical protein